ncbi:MAG: hypothetical protein E6G67_07120 [Actinobacteria bacterium]|nr:MAG: hypothetical protein E6G67_07120 [Actinomycetota bacterium]
MRALDCPVCGEVVQGEEDGRLLRVLREHIDARHPDADEDDEALRRRIEADAYAPAAGEPPWAY